MINSEENCDKAIEFIQSCLDENNPDDGLTFNERIEQRKKDLPKDIRFLVENRHLVSNSPNTPNFIFKDLEEECECEHGVIGDVVDMSPENKLNFAIGAKQEYLTKKRELNTEKARLRLETDWTKAIKGKDSPNDTDKKEWITFETHELQEEVDDLKCQSDYLWEVWELEKIMLRK